MNTLVLIVLLGWIPAVVLVFSALQPRRAVMVSFLTAWLFLPIASYRLPLFPDYTKMFATSVGVLLGAAIFDSRRLLGFRLKWFDLPMTAWCVCPILSSVANGLGAYDGISGTMSNIVTWAVPYFIGRVYFTDRESFRELAMGIFIGGLVYVPFCLFEIRMSPKLHHILYGYHQQIFSQSIRGGGWRPMVFMEHGLMVSSWMASASLVGYWLWLTGAVKRIGGVQIGWLLVLLLLTTIACKSLGAVLLLAVGAATLTAARWFRAGSLVGVLLLIPVAYIGLRTTGMWEGSHVVRTVAELFSEDRAQSLQYRFYNETMLIDRALQRPLLGWGGWDRNEITDEYGEKQSVVDGLWIVTLGKYGCIGLFCLYGVLLTAPARVWLGWNGARWGQTSSAASASLAILVILYAIDCLPNGKNPFFMLCSGALAAVPRKAHELNQTNSLSTSVATHPLAPQRRMWPTASKNLSQNRS